MAWRPARGTLSSSGFHTADDVQHREIAMVVVHEAELRAETLAVEPREVVPDLAAAGILRGVRPGAAVPLRRARGEKGVPARKQLTHA
jgi:hypothetical protein